ncbi:MAG: Mce-associated rane protein [Nocardioidaceae bacterium]|nr:Mce-associated rane protein [Nocardioidaceae bacterium]
MSRTSLIRAALALILAALCAWLVLFAVQGSEAAPGRTQTEQKAHEYADITRAAKAETLAFLAVDYTKMDELTQRVLSGATGTFHTQYKSSLKSLKSAATSQKSVSKGSIDEVGLSEVDSDSATVFVAASSKVKNTETKGKFQDRSWRIKLTMSKHGGDWLVSQLEFVS